MIGKTSLNSMGASMVVGLTLLPLLGCDPGHLYHPESVEEVVAGTLWSREVGEGVSVAIGPIYFLPGSKEQSISFRLTGEGSDGSSITGVSLTTNGRTYDSDVRVWVRDFKTDDSETLLPGETMPLREYTADWKFSEFLEEIFGPMVTVCLHVEMPDKTQRTVDITYRQLRWLEILAVRS